MIEDAKESVKEMFKDRFSSPLGVSFALSWFVWNFKAILVIFSSLDVAEKLIYIESFYSGRYGWILGLVGPFFTCCLTLLVFPFPSSLAFWWWGRYKARLVNLASLVAGYELLTVEKSKEMRAQLEESAKAYEKKLAEAKARIHALELNLQGLAGSATRPETEEEKLAKQLDFDSKAFLLDLSKATIESGREGVKIDSFKADHSTIKDPLRFTVAKDKAQQLGLVEAVGFNNPGYVARIPGLKLSVAGRSLVLYMQRIGSE